MDLSKFLNLSLSIITPFAFRCAAELKISDHIHAYHLHAMPLNELARSIPIAPEKEPMLGQVMRLLVQIGVFAQSDKGYMLTPVSELLLSNGPNMGPYICFMTNPQTVNPHSKMGDWFKSSGVGTIYQMANQGKPLWESIKEMPDFGNVVNEGMAAHSRSSMIDVITQCPKLFDGLNSLIDVGGGIGAATEVVAKYYPKLRCTVFDLPQVISTVAKSDLFDAVGGNMFEKIPPADAIMLKNVLHDWCDDDCIKILEKCREAISISKNAGKVIIIDVTIDLENHDQMTIETNLNYDIHMMVGCGSKERTRQEWHGVFEAAGFVNYKVHTVGIYSIYELLP